MQAGTASSSSFEHAGQLHRWLLALAFLLTLLAYSQVLHSPPVYDDPQQILDNPELHSWRSLPGFFTHHLWVQMNPGQKGSPYYRPVFKSWLLINYQLFGLHLPFWHAANILLHLLVVWLVYLLALGLTENKNTAAIAAMIFAVHPTHIETVTWLSGITDALAAVFFLGALILYLRFHRSGKPWFLAGSAFLFLFALLGKETCIALIPIVFVHAWLRWSESDSPFFLQRLRRATLSVAPFVGSAAVYMVFRSIALKSLSNVVFVPLPLSTVVFTVPSLAWTYVRHLVAPSQLSLFYDAPYIGAPSSRFYVPLIVLCLIAAGIFFALKKSRSPVAIVACALMLLPLLPAFNLAYLPFRELIHDRYLYLPSIGFSLLLALALRAIPAKGRLWQGQPALQMILVFALAGSYTLVTFVQNRYWTSRIVLYQHCVQVAPDNVNSLELLGQELLNSGRKEEALIVYARGCRVAPEWWDAHFIAGMLSYQTGRYPDAERYLRRAIQIDPRSGGEYHFLGATQLQMGQVAEAEVNLRKAVAILPNGRDFHLSLAQVLFRQGLNDEGVQELRAELNQHPDNDEARLALARAERTESR